MNLIRSYRYCIVPCCTSSSVKTPGKIFFSVPRNPVKRKAWTKAMKRDEKLNKELSFGTPLWCCEDHFVIPQDMKNYWQWRLTKNVKTFVLKPGVVPHVFDCQKKRPVLVERSAVKKRKRMRLVQEAVSSYDRAQILGTVILPGAVPSIFPNSPCFTSSEPSNAEENAEDKGITKEMGNLKAETANLQEQIKGEKGVQISAIQEPHEKPNSQKSNYLAVISQNKSAIILLPINAHQAATSVSGTESQNIAEKPIVIKQEPVESINEPPWPVIEKIHGAEEIAPSSISSSLSSGSPSSSSSSTCGSATILPLPISNPDFTNMDETSAAHVPNKPAQKRKIDETEPDAAQAKLCHLTKPSMPSKIHRIHILNPTHLHPINTKLNPTQTAETSKKSARSLNAIQAQLGGYASQSMPSKSNSKLHPPAKTSKKLLLPPETSKKLHLPAETSNESSDRSPLPTRNYEDATREMFQSLLDGAENNPLFGSRTTEMPGDLFDVFADLIAGKLRAMDWSDCAYALRVILDVVFKTGQVQHDSEV